MSVIKPRGGGREQEREGEKKRERERDRRVQSRRYHRTPLPCTASDCGNQQQEAQSVNLDPPLNLGYSASRTYSGKFNGTHDSAHLALMCREGGLCCERLDSVSRSSAFSPHCSQATLHSEIPGQPSYHLICSACT